MGRINPVSVQDVKDAEQRLHRFLPRTPLIRSLHRGAWLKLENFQITGAYKVRGALNALLLQKARGDNRTVVAASAGNHGAGVAWAAKQLGLSAVIVVPKNAPQAKIQRITKLGAQVVLHGDVFEDSLTWARQKAQEQDWRMLHAFEDPDVIAGQGTIALELLNLKPDVVILPVGGGGLAAGISIVLRAEGIRAVGVQIEGVDAMASALRGGPKRIYPRQTVADSLRVSEAGELTRSLCKKGLSEMILVTEKETLEAMHSLSVHERIRVEGAGAVSVAALKKVQGKRRVALVSGGNTDIDMRQILKQKQQPTPLVQNY
jgi:threonine dehydratase